MKVTIVPVDGLVQVNGRNISGLDLSFIDASIHAVVWLDDHGEVQIKNEAGQITGNVPLESLDDFQLALDAWEAARAVLDAPEPEPTIEERRVAAWDRIKADRERRRQSGVLVNGHWFHSNDTSRIQQIGLVMMGANIPPGLLWRTMDNGEVPMTPELAAGIFQATAASDAAHFEAAKAHRAAMEAAPDPDAYDFSSGWPAIYEA